MTVTNETDKIRQINVIIEPSKTIDVSFYKNNNADVNMSCIYIKSGQQEIQDYTDNVCKPNIYNYIIDEVDKAILPLLEETKTYAKSAQDSVRECIDTVSGLNMEDIIAIEANSRIEADKALQDSLDNACQNLETNIAQKADKITVYDKEATEALLSVKADLDSPQLSGIPTTPTASLNADDLQIANIATIRTYISESFSANNLYRTMTLTDTQWCCEWFADEAKTQRVWIEQGGVLKKNSTSGLSQYIITFLVPFSNNNYYFSRSEEHYYEGVISTCRAWTGHQGKSTTGIKYIIDNNYVSSSCWYACGK